MKLTKTLAVTGLATALMITGSGIVSADETAPKAETGSASVILSGSNGETPPEIIDPTLPVDPENPGVDPGETGQTGPLTIDYVPHFDFGSVEIGEKPTVTAATNAKASVQISDRRASGKGWSLTASLSEFTDAEDKTQELKGVSITLPAGKATTTEGNVSPEAVTLAADLKANGESATIFKADENAGLGSWANVITPSDVKLSVGSGNLAGDYSATMTYTLANAPK
ncbi:WxL domain-containing protein [Brochothrix thermosphacta]|uniref:Putative LPXTG-motif cell wall anchor domain protein n=2 Tax=Brochothrix thermosphacta TaxID=2756 RepID=A0A2X0SC03_BROTH|nr:putative LPXTG-motif cell wall anchor domain protein [Brochothrix thermosphacta]